MANTPLTIPELGDRFIDYRDPIWGDSYNWSWNRQPNEVEWVVIHHSVTSHDATPDDIALLHKARGWGGIGYHFVITKDGNVYYVGDVGTARANVLNMNEKVIGVCLVGDFTKHLPSDEQIVSAHYLCKFFLDNTAVWPQLKTWEGSVVGHKELQATACPGTSWKGAPDSMFERIKNKIPYTAPAEPQPDPLSACLAQNKKLVDELLAKGKELEEVQKKLVDAENLCKNLTAEKNELTAKIKEIEGGFANCQSSLSIANAQIAKLEERITVVEGERNSYKRYYEAALEKGLNKATTKELLVALIKRIGNG